MNMAAQCLKHPDEQVSIIDLAPTGRVDVTYADLSEMVDGLARALQAEVRPGDRVGVLLSQSPWCAAAHLAIWKIGAISVPLFKLFKHDALQSRISDAAVSLVLTDPEGAALVGELARCW
ncbi:AMP-binding protein, partial [Synechococcus sp. MU1644]|nr:AMP-binding protein [Synechococcus sp. MU1644]